MSIDTTRIRAKASHIWWQWNVFLDKAFGFPRRTVRYRLAFKYRVSSWAKYGGRAAQIEDHEGFDSFKKAQAAYTADLSFFQGYERVESFVVCLNYHHSRKWEESIHVARHEGTEAHSLALDAHGGGKCKACGRRLLRK
jgi:hypothetical protein